MEGEQVAPDSVAAPAAQETSQGPESGTGLEFEGS